MEDIEQRPQRAIHRDASGVQDLWRTPGGVTAWLDHFDPTRVIDAWVMTFERMTVGSRLDGEPHPSKILRGAVDRWIQTIDPRDVEFKVDHGLDGADEVASWFSFQVLPSGLFGRALVDEGEVGDQLLVVLDNDPSWGFSIDGTTPDWTSQERILDGDQVTVFSSLRITEAGPTPSPADDACYVVRIAGREPLWMGRQDAIDRQRTLRDMRPVPSLVG